MKQALKSTRPHVGIFGRTNVGKSSFINAIADQQVAIISEIAGTTTDPVKKYIEIMGLGPLVIIDTGGINDHSELGNLRVEQTQNVLKQIDCAILILAENIIDDDEYQLLAEFKRKEIPFFVIKNKSDIIPMSNKLQQEINTHWETDILEVSCKTNFQIEPIVKLLIKHIPDSIFTNPTILGDLVYPRDLILLVTPIDAEAPQGRMILPQMQTLRDVLDNNCIATVLKETELEYAFGKLGWKPSLVVTDSQAFKKVEEIIPKDVPLTSFSILFARLKGDFERYIEGTKYIRQLCDGDRVLIMESCSHHVVEDDIGREKIPKWLQEFTGKDLNFDVISGLDLPKQPILNYALLIQCGGCMLTRKQILNRLNLAIQAGIPISNYGMTIAYCLRIFDRAIEPFKNITSI